MDGVETEQERTGGKEGSDGIWEEELGSNGRRLFPEIFFFFFSSGYPGGCFFSKYQLHCISSFFNRLPTF